MKCIISEVQQPSQARNLQPQIDTREFTSTSESDCSASRQPINQTGSSIAVPSGPKTCQFSACGWVAAMGTLSAKEPPQQNFPSNSISNPSQGWIHRIIDFFAGQAPQWRFPENRMFSPESHPCAVKPIDTQDSQHRNENSRIAPQVIANDVNFLGSGETVNGCKNRKLQKRR